MTRIGDVRELSMGHARWPRIKSEASSASYVEQQKQRRTTFYDFFKEMANVSRKRTLPPWNSGTMLNEEGKLSMVLESYGDESARAEEPFSISSRMKLKKSTILWRSLLLLAQLALPMLPFSAIRAFSGSTLMSWVPFLQGLSLVSFGTIPVAYVFKNNGIARVIKRANYSEMPNRNNKN